MANILVKTCYCSIYINCHQTNNVLQDRILFGSCYPGFSLESAINEYMKNGLSEEALPKVLYHNAAKLLKLAK